MLVEAGDSVRYLEFYHYCAGQKLSSKFDDGFWTKTTLQLAQAEPSIRNALVALGYLTQAEPGSLRHARIGFKATHEHKTLFRHYNKAMVCLAQRMSEPSYTTDIGLIACLLFVCIEFIRGDYHTAFTHLKNGFEVMAERMAHGDAAIPDSLLGLFNRTMTAALLYGMTVPDIFNVSITGPQDYPQLRFGFYEMPTPVPDSYSERAFASVEEAQTAHTQLRNASILFIRDWGQKLFLHIPVPLEALIVQKQLIRCLEVWYSSLQLLEQSGRLSEEDKVKLCVTKLIYYPLYVAMGVATDIDQMQYDRDDYTKSFQEIIRNARIVLDYKGLLPNGTSPPPPIPTANFTFEVSLVPALYYAVTRCRCPATRREALSLLELPLPREALWDAEQHAVVGRRVMEIEEQKLDPETGWPTASSRLWGTAIDGDMDDKGGFWCAFSYADWARTHHMVFDRRRRLDAQWDEWIVLKGENRLPAEEGVAYRSPAEQGAASFAVDGDTIANAERARVESQQKMAERIAVAAEKHRDPEIRSAYRSIAPLKRDPAMRWNGERPLLDTFAGMGTSAHDIKHVGTLRLLLCGICADLEKKMNNGRAYIMTAFRGGRGKKCTRVRQAIRPSLSGRHPVFVPIDLSIRPCNMEAKCAIPYYIRIDQGGGAPAKSGLQQDPIDASLLNNYLLVAGEPMSLRQRHPSQECVEKADTR
jgi:hypothetical protein